MNPSPQRAMKARDHQLHIPEDIQAACRALDWQILDVNNYAGETAYLIRPPTGIIEPYTGRAIRQSAQAAQRSAQ